MSPPSLRHPARLAGASLLRLQSDERLAELAANGHEAAFGTIVDRYRTPLTRYCAGIVGPSRAEDVVQQALINAHHALQRTDEVRHLRSWLYRIAHNASLNVLRAVRDDVSLDAASDAAAVAEDGPAAVFERNERFRATVAAMRELPERQRAALVLRELEGRSHEEIAETLGVTSGAARQHLMRARVALRGAVTAITPYPLVVRLAEMLAAPGAAGWTDAAVGAGVGATLAKLTAGVAATGALVGGAVGTERIIHHRDSAPKAAERSSGGSATSSRPAATRVVGLAPAGVAGAASDGRKGTTNGRGEDHNRGDGSSGRGSGGSDRNSANDDADRGHEPHGRGGRSGALSGSGQESSGRDSRGGRESGSSGSGVKDTSSARRDAGARGSNGSGGHGGRRSKGSGSRSSGSGGKNDSKSSTSGRGRGGSNGDDRSGSGSARGSDDLADTPVTKPAPTVATTTPSTTTSPGSDGNSGSGRADDPDAPDPSGSN